MGKGKKRALLWSFSPDDWGVCDQTLKRFFMNEDIEVIHASFMTPCPKGLDTIDVALVTLSEWFYYVKKLLPPNTPVLWIKYTISQSDYKRIASAAQKECVSVVADTPLYAQRQYRMLISMGIPEEKMNIWYSGQDPSTLNRLALLFEQAGLKEEKGHEYIRFHGQGLICAETLMQLAVVLELPHLLQTEFYHEYVAQTMYVTRQMGDIIEMGDFYAMSQDKVVNGILYFVPGGYLSYYSYNAAILLEVTPYELIGRKLEDVFPFLNQWMDHIGDFGEQVVKWQGKEFSFDIWTSPTHGSYAGYILISDYKAEREKELRLRTKLLKNQQYAKYTFSNIKGDSRAIQRCRETALKFAHSRATVLITGSSGSGKELFASAIHNASPRKKGPFVAINCGALVETLLESELFGYEAGAFTGARKEGKQGVFEMAHEGTLFLDEIEEMPQSLQVKLLRVLQEREVVRVGGQQVIPVNVRVIAATNRNLLEQVKAGCFRADLYYRLNVLPLEIPGLNERREDILPLFDYIRDKEGYRFTLEPQAERCVEEYDYQGNVRELYNCVEYLGSLDETIIRYADLPTYMKEGRDGANPNGDSAEPPAEKLLQGNRQRESQESLHQKKHTALQQEMQEEMELLQEDAVIFYIICSLLKRGKTAGRKSIFQELQRMGHPMSEMRIRKNLQKLNENGKILRGKGRAGISIPVLTKEQERP